MRTFSIKEEFKGVDPNVDRLRKALKEYIGYTGRGIGRYNNTSWWGSKPIFTLNGTPDFMEHCASKLNKTYIDPKSQCYKVKCGSDEIYVNQLDGMREMDNDVINKFNRR